MSTSYTRRYGSRAYNPITNSSVQVLREGDSYGNEAIDPIVAKNLLAYVIQMGINNPLDLMMRADLFNIIHKGLIAYDKNESKFDTTMKNRNNETRPVIRNDYLQF